MIEFIDGRPKCFKCDNPALTNVAGRWVCGECFTEYVNKKRKMEELILLSE